MFEVSSMYHPGFDDALDELRMQFPGVPDRVLCAVLHGYLEQEKSMPRATAATKQRIIDACAIA
jgi:hypothetical protein